MMIQDLVLKAVQDSERFMFPEDIARVVPAKEDTIRSTCFDLLEKKKLKAARKGRESGTTACVFWVRDEQIKGVEALLMPYTKRPRKSPRKATTPASAKDEPDMLFSIPGETSTLQLKFSQAETLYKQLHRIFGSRT